MSTSSSRMSECILSWAQWEPVMVLEPGQPLDGLKSGVKPSVNWGLWGKFLTPLWAPGAELGSQQESMIMLPSMSPSKGNKTYPLLGRRWLALARSDLSVLGP